jgi:hypothetical protein
MMENGHCFIMAYDPQIIDMSQVVPGGVQDAIYTLTGGLYLIGSYEYFLLDHFIYKCRFSNICPAD